MLGLKSAWERANEAHEAEEVVNNYRKIVAETRGRIDTVLEVEAKQLGDKTLVLTGGNLRIPMTIGALLALQERNQLRDYNTIMASSVGVLSAIYAVLDKPIEAVKLLDKMKDYTSGKIYDVIGLIDNFDNQELEAVLSSEKRLIITVTDAKSGHVLVYSNKEINKENYDLPNEVSGDFEFLQINSVEEFRQVLTAAIHFPVKTKVPAELPNGKTGFDTYNSARIHELLQACGPNKDKETNIVDIGAVGAKKGPVGWIIDNELDQALWTRVPGTRGNRIFRPWTSALRGRDSFHATYRRIQAARANYEENPNPNISSFGLPKNAYPNFGGSRPDQVAANFLFGYECVRDELSSA